MDRVELLWRQYELNNQLYKGYLELVVKINTFYYAITGAILSFYFSRGAEDDLIKWSLLLPLVMSVALAMFFFFGALAARITRAETFALRDALKLQAAPEHAVLIVMLAIFGFLMVLISIALGYLVWCR